MSKIITNRINSVAKSIAGLDEGRGICYGTASVVTALHLRGYSTDYIRKQFEMVNRLMENNAGGYEPDMIQRYDDLG